MSEAEAQAQAFVFKAYWNLGDCNTQSALRTTPWADNGAIPVTLFIGKSREL